MSAPVRQPCDLLQKRKRMLRSFIITVDTEGDDVWSRPPDPGTRNASYLPRFQSLCESLGLKPTYLVNYEMALDRQFVRFGRDLLARNAGEIGMHLHAWNSPPVYHLTDNDCWYQPFLIEYPKEEIIRKVGCHTQVLEDVFGVKMLSHRSGRWAMNLAYADVLRGLGYKVDCSVTPHVDWRDAKGSPDGAGGVDYRKFPEHHYWMSRENIALSGQSSLLEVPMTIVDRSPLLLALASRACENITDMPKRALRRAWPVEWLRPDGTNLASMLRILDIAIAQNRPYVEFMIHSSELMPAGSPYFPTAHSVEMLYSNMKELFTVAARNFVGSTLAEFHDRVLSLR